MKILLFVMTLSLTNLLYAQSNAANNVFISSKEEALQQCEIKAQQSPPELQEQMYLACLCMVEHTDFARALELYQNNDIDGLHQLYVEASQACAS